MENSRRSRTECRCRACSNQNIRPTMVFHWVSATKHQHRESFAVIGPMAGSSKSIVANNTTTIRMIVRGLEYSTASNASSLLSRSKSSKQYTPDTKSILYDRYDHWHLMQITTTTTTTTTAIIIATANVILGTTYYGSRQSFVVTRITITKHSWWRSLNMVARISRE